jgi:hypothetical protein
MDAPSGCPFHPRCQFALEACSSGVPAPVPVRGGFARCIRANENLAEFAKVMPTTSGDELGEG